MGTLDLVLVIFGSALLSLSLVSRLTTRHSLSPVVFALTAGVLVGPQALGLLDLTAELPRHTLLEGVCRVALALLVTAIGVRIRPADLRENRRRLVLLLGIAMPAMWVSTGIGAVLVLGLPPLAAMALGAALTPTDPGVSSTVSTGTLAESSLPRPLRMTLQTESAANDGLALPFVLLSGLLATLPGAEALRQWVLDVAVEVGLAVAVGAAAGGLTTLMLLVAERDRAVARTYLPLVGPAMSLVTLAGAHLLGGSGVLGAFVAGLTLSLTLTDDEARASIEDFQESVGHAALITVFVVLGTVLPLRAWLDLGWAGAAFAAVVVLLRRLPSVAPLLRLAGTSWHGAAFLGWFGPLGVAGVYYLAYLSRYDLPDYERVFAAGTLAVVVSVLVAAVTATPAVNAYRRQRRDTSRS